MMQSIKRAKTLTVVGVMALLCLVGLKARAAVSVSDFIGDAEGGAPQCSVTVTNSGADVANPILILVRYEDGMLTDVKFDYPDSDLQSGGSAELAANLPAAPITDLTRITAFVLEDRQYAGIVESGLLEIERQGSANTGIDSIRFADIEAELATIDNEAKTIQLYLPLYDEVGEAIDTDELSLSVTVAEPAEQVQVGDTLLTGDEQVKEGVISLAQKSLTVISEDGTRDEYQLTIWRTLKENMEEGSRLNGYSMGKAGQAGMYVGDFAVNGTKASAIIKPSMNSASVGDTSYFAGIGLGVKPISDALPAVDAAPFPVGSSGADGNAMTLRKDTHKSGIGATGCGLLYLYGSQMEGFNQAGVIEMEYDMAIGLNVTGPVRDSSVAGLDISTSKGTYRISNSGGSNVTSAKITAGNASGSGVSSGMSAGQWRHIKLTMERQEDGNFLFTTCVDDAEIPSVTMGRPTQFMFGNSALRAAELWLDNISIMYN